MVSNRAPVTVEVRKGRLETQRSPGGLATGVASFMERRRESGFSEDLWIGWPGVPAEDAPAGLSQALLEHRVHPVMLSGENLARYYDGLCNSTIWPLFHYFPDLTKYSEDDWLEYRKVNELFCREVIERASGNDWIWVHDYHLMLLPAMLRERLPDATIGYFLHIPFPSFEIFRILPRQWGTRLLSGLMGSDVIGFHTQEYTQNFLRCALKILGIEHNLGEMEHGDRLVKADTFPMGIDFEMYASAAGRGAVRRYLGRLRENLPGVSVVLSVDRLDYTKGIANRLRGFKLFLEDNPEYREKVVLALVVVPSRTSVGDYQRMKREIDILVGEINGQFGNPGWTPILYQYTTLSQDELVAYYLASDVAMLTPKRDGMNLVAKEYLAAKGDGSGVLVLSEMAGAARELGEAVLVNPNHVKEISAALAEALRMPGDERAERVKAMRERLRRYDVVRWAEDFLESMQRMSVGQAGLREKLAGPETRSSLLDDCGRSKRSLFALGYDGTLVPLNRTPDLAAPGPETLELLSRLTRLPGAHVVIVSGRDRETLDSWFGRLDVSLVAEHGAWLREAGGGWNTLATMSQEWKENIVQLLERYVDRLPGSFIEEKEYSVAWHYRQAESELGNRRAKELTSDLIDHTANMNLQVLTGSKVIEVRHAGVDKGFALKALIGDADYDFIFAAGDDWTDEDLFEAVPASSYTFKVAGFPSKAEYYLRDQSEVVRLLEDIARDAGRGRRSRS